MGGLPEVKTKTELESRHQNTMIGAFSPKSRPFGKIFHVRLSLRILGVSGRKHLLSSRHGLHSRVNLRPVLQSSRLEESREQVWIATSLDLPKTKGATIHCLFCRPQILQLLAIESRVVVRNPSDSGTKFTSGQECEGECATAFITTFTAFS